jgi:hypothetical protein
MCLLFNGEVMAPMAGSRNAVSALTHIALCHKTHETGGTPGTLWHTDKTLSPQLQPKFNKFEYIKSPPPTLFTAPP